MTFFLDYICICFVCLAGLSRHLFVCLFLFCLYNPLLIFRITYAFVLFVWLDYPDICLFVCFCFVCIIHYSFFWITYAFVLFVWLDYPDICLFGFDLSGFSKYIFVCFCFLWIIQVFFSGLHRQLFCFAFVLFVWIIYDFFLFGIDLSGLYRPFSGLYMHLLCFVCFMQSFFIACAFVLFCFALFGLIIQTFVCLFLFAFFLDYTCICFVLTGVSRHYSDNFFRI